MLLGVPQGSTLEPLFFSIFNDDLCTKIHSSEFLLFADDLEIFHVIKSADDFELLQSDIDSVEKWCIESYMKMNIFKTNITSFTCKTNSIHFYYFFGYLLILRTDCVKDLWVMTDGELHFHRHVDCLHSQTLKLLGLIRFIIYNLSSLDSLKVLYCGVWTR
jgi:hypothetical protein